MHYVASVNVVQYLCWAYLRWATEIFQCVVSLILNDNLEAVYTTGVSHGEDILLADLLAHATTFRGGDFSQTFQHTCQARETCADKGVGPSVPHYNRVVWCRSTQNKFYACQGLKVLSPDTFDLRSSILVVVVPNNAGRFVSSKTYGTHLRVAKFEG